MRIGGSVGGRFSRPIEGITCYENRLLQNSEHKYFWTDAKFCISNNIYLIINIDSYLTNSRWYPTNQTLRDFVIWTKNELKKLGANKYNTRFTADNESDEYCDFEYYMNYVRVIHDALGRDFDLGAGNFRTQSKEWYEHLAEQYIGGHYEVFDFHMQDGLDEVTDIDIYIRWIEYIKNKYGIKRIAVTEGNNFYNVTTLHGHNLLKAQINYAEYVGCEDFCFPYVNWMNNGEEKDNNMAYNWNFHPVSPFWEDMKNFIRGKNIIIEEFDDMKLKVLKLGSRGNQVKFLQEILAEEYGFENTGGYDGIFGALTEKQVKEYQRANGLSVDGIAGKDTMFDLIWNAEKFGRDYWWIKLQICMAFEG